MYEDFELEYDSTFSDPNVADAIIAEASQNIERFVRKATKNFAPGDTVYQVSSVYKTESCGLCAGTGKVLCAIKEGNEQRRISCPDCNGTGNLRIVEKAVQRKTIDRIYLTLCFEPDRVLFWNTSAIMLRGNEFRCDPRNLYATEKEALEAIKEAETNA